MAKSGIEQCRDTVTRLKNNTAKSKEVVENKLEETRVMVQGLSVGKDVADFYKKNAKVGFENMASDALPTLKVTETNSKGELENGNRPKTGYFYYTKDKSEFQEIEVSIMNVSRGFYVAPLGKETGNGPKFQQIISGMILEGMKPFIMYVSGKRLNPLWELGKELSPFTKSKESPVPMMAFKIILTSTKYKHEYGESHYVNFKVLKNGEGNIQLITDMAKLGVIREGIDSMNEAVESIIESTEVDKNTGNLIKNKEVASYEEVSNAFADEDGGQDVPF